MSSHEFPDDYKEGLVPCPRYELVLVEESSGLEKVHIRLKSEVKEILQRVSERYPHITWTAATINSPSHRYPYTIEERHRAYELGSSYIALAGRIADPQGVAQDILKISMAIALTGGLVTDEQFIEAFNQTPDLGVPLADQTKLAYYTEKSRSYSDMLDRVLKTKIGESHPYPHTTEQQKRAATLRKLYQQIMFELVYHDARNFALGSAARLLQLGYITNSGLEEIHDSYMSALERDRGARMYEEPSSQSLNDIDIESDDNICSWGTISW